MEPSAVIDLAREALWITILVSAPLLGVTLVIGLAIGVVQAATSINEMTLSFIPKLVALAGAIVLFGNWQIALLVDYVRGIYERIPGLFL
jgi:flagellar biosynthesis protein FliQ